MYIGGGTTGQNYKNKNMNNRFVIAITFCLHSMRVILVLSVAFSVCF